MNFVQYSIIRKNNCSFLKLTHCCLLSIAVILFSPSVTIASTYENSPPLFIEYTQHSTDSIEVGYRLTSSTEEPIAELKINDELSINSDSSTPYPKEGDTTAVLFLVDISDPARQKIIKKNISQIINILESSQAHHSFGLASFAENLNILSPIGTEKDELMSKVRELKATGSETLLYQYIGESIEILNAYEAKRRVLFVFSDGKSEDQRNVYNHEYVINKTKERNLIINGLAFPPKPRRENTSHYQTLERLASEAGGVFIKATPTGDIEDSDITELLSSSDSGGYWKFNIKSLTETALSGNITATLNVSQGQNITSLPITISLPENKNISQIQKILAITLPVLLSLGLIIFLLRRKKRKPVITYAFIDTLDGNDRYDINKKTYKIGRNNENDLVLANNSVSSFHAQIHLNRDDEFIITDLQSTNGIVVNNEDITNHILEDKDTIEIGEVRLRFSMQ